MGKEPLQGVRERTRRRKVEEEEEGEGFSYGRRVWEGVKERGKWSKHEEGSRKERTREAK